MIRRTIVSNMSIPKELDLMSPQIKRQTMYNNSFTFIAVKDFDYPGRDVYMHLKVPKGYQEALYIMQMQR